MNSIKIIKKECKKIERENVLSECLVFCIHAKVSNQAKIIEQVIRNISDSSWINDIDSYAKKKSFEVRVEKTTRKIVDDILMKVDDCITKEAGEYVISDSAQEILKQEFLHKKIPLAELFKERVKGNGSFDFHMEKIDSHIIFGEAKYSSKKNPHSDAINQIVDFINRDMDVSDLVDLEGIVSDKAIHNFENKRGYAAAFSLNRNFKNIFKAIMNNENINSLLKYEELYLVAIEICKK